MMRRPSAPAPILALALALGVCTDVGIGVSGLAAAEPMSAEEFDAYTRGKTLFFSQNGMVYGAEIYLEDRRVRWSFLDGECKDGYWYETNGQICFVYEDRPDPQCWTFTLGASGLIAEFENEPGSANLYEAQNLDEEMICLGPKIGV